MKNQNRQNSLVVVFVLIFGLLAGSLATYLYVKSTGNIQKDLLAEKTAQYIRTAEKAQKDLLAAITAHSIFDDAFIRLDQSYAPYGDQVKGTTNGPAWYKDGSGKFTHAVTVTADSFLKIDNFKTYIQYALIQQLEKAKDYLPAKQEWIITKDYKEIQIPEENSKRYLVNIALKLIEK